MLNFRDLRASRVQGDLKFQNTKLMIFPDYSVETQKLCNSFAVKVALKTQGNRYNALFPARLPVQDGETSRFFHMLQKASAWLDFLSAPLPWLREYCITLSH